MLCSRTLPTFAFVGPVVIIDLTQYNTADFDERVA
jgi:hypothetical protein